MKKFVNITHIVSTKDDECPAGYVEIETVLEAPMLRDLLRHAQAELESWRAMHQRLANDWCKDEARHIEKRKELEAQIAMLTKPPCDHSSGNRTGWGNNLGYGEMWCTDCGTKLYSNPHKITEGKSDPINVKEINGEEE